MGKWVEGEESLGAAWTGEWAKKIKKIKKAVNKKGKLSSAQKYGLLVFKLCWGVRGRVPSRGKISF